MGIVALEYGDVVHGTAAPAERRAACRQLYHGMLVDSVSARTNFIKRLVSETADEKSVEENWTPEESTEPEEIEQPETPEMAEEAESPETPEMAEHAEYLKNNEIVLDDASLEDKANSEFTSDEFDIDVAIQSLDDYKFDTEAWDEDSFEQAYEDDDIVEIPEDDATFAESEEETVYAE